MSLEETKAVPSANRATTPPQTAGSPSPAELARLHAPDALERDARRGVSVTARLHWGRPINLERRARFGRFGA